MLDYSIMLKCCPKSLSGQFWMFQKHRCMPLSTQMFSTPYQNEILYAMQSSPLDSSHTPTNVPHIPLPTSTFFQLNNLGNTP